MTSGPNKQIGLKGVVGVAAICVAVAIAFAVVGKRERDAVNDDCFLALHRNWRLITLYTFDNDFRYPIDPWKQVALQPRGWTRQELACPKVWSPTEPDISGYAFNISYVGQIEGGEHEDDTPMLFETDIARSSVVTDFGSASRAGRHGGLSNFITRYGSRGQVDMAGHLLKWKH